MQLLIATTNPGKVRELREMLGSHAFAFTDLAALEGKNVGPEVEEHGLTFRANACCKASEYARRARTWAVADDSGLEVDALAGKPGVHSARWAQINDAGRGDAANNTLLLRQLEGVADERRTARFVCVLALADPAGRIVLTVADFVEGRILREARGSNGFGYDPIFLVEHLGRTTAELDPREKHRISHRGKALRRLAQLMVQLKFPREGL